VLAVAVDHPLAGRGSASLEMLADFQHGNTAQAPAYWADSFVPSHTRRGHAIVRGPLMTNTDELFALVSSGETVNILPSHSVRYWPRPDIAWLPFRDLGPLAYAMVWRAETETDPIRALASIARGLGPLHIDDH